MEELQSFLREHGYDEKVVAVIRQNVRQLMTQEDVGFANMQLQDTLESSEGIVALFIVQNLLRQLNLGWTEQVFLRETGFDPDRNNSNASDLYITTLMRDGQSTILESLIEWYERNERSIITDGGSVRSIRAHVSGDGGKMAVKRNVMDREQNDKKIRKVMGNQQVLLTSPNLTQQSHHPKRRALSTMMSLEELDHNLPSRVGPIANVVPTVVEASEESAPCNRLPLRDDGEQEPRKLTVQEVDHKPNLMESFDKSDPSHKRSLEMSSKRPNHPSNRLHFWRGAQLENGKYVAAERVDDVLDKSMNEDANAVQDRFHGTSQDETQETWVPLLPHANRTFVLTQYQTHKLRKLLGVPNYMYFKRTTYQIGDAFLINSNQTVLNLLGLDPPDQDSSASESNRFSDDKQYVRNNGFVDKCTSDDSPELASTPIASNRRRNLQVSFAQEQTFSGESQHSHSESALARRSLIDRFRRNLSKEDVGNDPDQSRTACPGHACSDLKRLRNRQLDGTHTKSLPHNASFWSTKTNYSMTTGTTTEKRSPDRIPSSVCPSLRSTKSNATPSNSHTVLTTTFDMSSQVLSPILKEVVEDALNQPRNDPALSCAQKMQQTKLANGLQFEEGGDGFLTGYLNVTYKLPPGMDNSLIVHSVMNGAIDLEPKIIELVVRDESDIEVDVDVKLAAKSFQGAFNSGDMQRWKLLGSKSMGGSRSHSSLPLTKTEQRNLKRTLQVNIPVIVQRTGSRITISPQTSFCRKRCSK